MSYYHVDQARANALADNGGQEVNSQQVAQYADGYYTSHGRAALSRFQHQADVHQTPQEQEIDVVNTPPYSNSLSHDVGVDEDELYGHQQGSVGESLLIQAAREATPPSTVTTNSDAFTAYVTNQLKERRVQKQQQQQQTLTAQEIAANLFWTHADAAAADTN